MEGTQTDFHRQFQTYSVCVCVYVCLPIYWHTEQPGSERQPRLAGCKAISLFGDTVVCVCGLELTPEQVSHAKCSTITELLFLI